MGNRTPPEIVERISILRETTIMNNREKITEVLRRSPLTPLAYSDIKATADVPVGSFDRTLVALIRDGTVRKAAIVTGWPVMVRRANRRKPARVAAFSCIARAAMGRTHARISNGGRGLRTFTIKPSCLNNGVTGVTSARPSKRKTRTREARTFPSMTKKGIDPHTARGQDGRVGNPVEG
jgi:hypothetical protein